MRKKQVTGLSFVSLAALGALVLSTSPASALGEVSKGAVELDDAKKDKAKTLDSAATDTTELAIQGGGLLASGNAQSLALTGGSRFFLRRGMNEFSANLVGNYARALQAATATDGTPPSLATTVENIQGRIRYDRFLTENFSVFFALYGRHDQFQGLDFRFLMDPGVAYYFIRSDARALWLEGGYDLQIDDRSGAALELARASGASASDLEDPKVVHNARFYLGYKEKLGDRLKFEFGTEFFKSLVKDEAFRWNVAAELNTQLVDKFSLAIGVQSFYDSAPLTGVKNHDLLSTLSFVYTML